MKRVLLLAAVLLPWPLAAQLKLYVVQPSGESAVGESYLVGTVQPGDYVDTAFRIRNTSSDVVSIQGLNVAGSGFSWAVPLSKLPVGLGAGQALDVFVRFAPGIQATYSAYFNINGVRYTILLGNTAPGLVLTLKLGASETTVGSGRVIDFGFADAGSSTTLHFALSNPAGQAMPVDVLSVQGAGFRGPIGVQAPFTLQPQQSVAFDIAFEPKTAGAAQGSLLIGRRSFALSGTARTPSFPKPLIAIDPPSVRAGQQAKVSVRLESAPITAGSGELRIDFRPDVAGQANDPAIMFLSTGTRSAPFTVSLGEQDARFGNAKQMDFQTGSTAGTIVFTAVLGQYSEQAAVTVPVGPVVLDPLRTLRSAEGLEVQLIGFDTARSASLVSFTFYDLNGLVVAPDAIFVDLSAAFRSYFNTSQLGGIFSLRAVFPVTGNVLRIGAVEVAIANSSGATGSPRTAFQ
jgi:hypothetical protein